MSDEKRLGEQLLYSLLKESAENFFGRRVKIEKEVDILKAKIEELKKRVHKIEILKSILSHLLLNKKYWQDFWQLIGTPLTYPELKVQNLKLKKPLFFFFSAYKKEFIAYYKDLRKEIEYYLYGEEVYDKETKAKKVTFNYNIMTKLIQSINEKIKDINTYYEPSSFLQFSNRFSFKSNSKQDITGSMFVYDIDKNFKMKMFKLEDINLPEYKEIPFNKDIEKKIGTFLKKLYKENTQKIKELF